MALIAHVGKVRYLTFDCCAYIHFKLVYVNSKCLFNFVMKSSEALYLECSLDVLLARWVAYEVVLGACKTAALTAKKQKQNTKLTISYPLKCHFIPFE